MKFFKNRNTNYQQRNITVAIFTFNTIKEYSVDIYRPNWSFVFTREQLSLDNYLIKQISLNELIIKQLIKLEKNKIYIDLKLKTHDTNFTEACFIYKGQEVKKIDLSHLQQLNMEDAEEYIREAIEILLIKIQKI